MSRITLIHWNAEEAKKRAEGLRKLGHRTNTVGPKSEPSIHTIKKNPPDVFVIDLNRLPAQGRDIAVYLRRQSSTRRVPIIFLGGEDGKRKQVKRVVPDAVFSDWRRVRSALRQAKRFRSQEPIVPAAPHFFTGVPLAKKLGLKAGSRVSLMGAPPGFEKKLGKLPESIQIRTQARSKADLILLFAKSQTDLKKRFSRMERILEERGRFWIVWPKKSSGLSTDLNQTYVRSFGLDAGYVDFKICAVDETWSGLQFTRRRK